MALTMCVNDREVGDTLLMKGARGNDASDPTTKDEHARIVITPWAVQRRRKSARQHWEQAGDACKSAQESHRRDHLEGQTVGQEDQAVVPVRSQKGVGRNFKGAGREIRPRVRDEYFEL